MKRCIIIAFCLSFTCLQLSAQRFLGRLIGDAERALMPRLEQTLENLIAPQLRASIVGIDATQIYTEIARQGEVTDNAVNVHSKNPFSQESVAQAWCPTICKNHLFMRWNGQWDTSINYGSYCGCIPTQETVAIAAARVKYKKIIQAAEAQQAAAARQRAAAQARALAALTPQQKAALAAKKEAEEEAAERAGNEAYEQRELAKAYKFYGSPSQLQGNGTIEVQAWRNLQTESQAQSYCPVVCENDFAMRWTGGWGLSAATNEPACDCAPTQETHAIVAQAISQKKPLHYGRIP